MYNIFIGDHMNKTIKIQRLANDAEGLAYLENEPVYIYYALPNETVRVDINKNKRGALEGKIIEIVKKSDDRINPICPYYTICGGCTMMHLKYNKTLEYKMDKLKFLLKCQKIKIDNIKINNIIKSPEILSYRNKTEIKIQKIGKNIVSGLYRKGTNQLFNMAYCPIQSNKINDFYKKVIKDIKLSNIPIYNKKEKSGTLFEIGIRENIKHEMMVYFYLKDDFDISDFANDLLCKYQFIKSIYKIILKDPDDTKRINLKEVKVLGDDYLSEYYPDNKFINLSPTSFFQLNYKQAMNVYSEFLKLVNFKKSDIIIDAYSGVSSISIFLSKYVKKIYSVEINKDATRAARDAIVKNKIDNIEIIADDFFKFSKNKKDIKIDKLIIDPPRTGLGADVIKNIFSINPENIIYISCDAKTLSTDLKYLERKYKIISITPFDMFPMTSHIETVALLSKLGGVRKWKSEKELGKWV